MFSEWKIWEKCKRSKYLNYAEHLLILISTVAGSFLISSFVSLVCVPIFIGSSALGIKTGPTISVIKKKKSIIKKTKKQNVRK